MVSRWVKDKDKILPAAAVNRKKKLLKVRPSTKHSELFNALFKRFKDARDRGSKVNFNWLWSKARLIHAEQTGNPDAVVQQHHIITFIERYKIRMRAKQRNKKVSKESLILPLKKWHSTTREKLIRVGKNDDYDPKWGRFRPSQRYNVDQSPLAFALDGNKTYDHVDEGVKNRDVIRAWNIF